MGETWRHRRRYACRYRQLASTERVSLLPVREDDEDQQWTDWILFASDYRALSRVAPRKNHTWVICHLAGPIRDVGPEDRRESFAGARRRYGFDEARPLPCPKIQAW